MLSAQALIKGIVARLDGFVNLDNPNLDISIRLGPRGELFTLPLVRKHHTLADAGSYYVTHNNQTGVATGTPATFSATAPFMIVENHNAPSTNLRCYLDYMALVTTAAGGFASGGVNLQLAMSMDPETFRFSVGGSGGTDLTPNAVNTNTEAVNGGGGITIRVGAVTSGAASAGVRNLVGLRTLRPAVSTTVLDVVGEMKVLNFGGVEAMLNGNIVVANANLISHPLPAVVIGPSSSLLLYLILNGTTPSAASYAPEVGYFVR